MAETAKVISDKRYAVVTGANKGIGLEICRQLAGHGITVVLTARDEKKGLDAFHKLNGSGGISGDLLFFHQLEVTDSSSVASLAEFIKNQFGRLDILVNNAGVLGAICNPESLKAVDAGDKEVEWKTNMEVTKESAIDCLNTNYYGAKRMVESFIPLLHLSQSPRIVNIASQGGKLEFIPNEWAKGILSDADNLTEERVDEVLSEYLKTFKGGPLAKGQTFVYTLSKAALNAYTRILAKKFPKWKVNSICPGIVKTDMNYNTGFLSVEEGARCPVNLALLPDDGPSGLFYIREDVSPF